MSDDDTSTLQDVYQWAAASGSPDNLDPDYHGQGVVVLDHDIEAVDPTFTNQNLVWECQDCGERGEDLGVFPVVCRDDD